jgi:Quinohemoprotein amine dehydrogenase A, alpha subunit, haem binding.
MPRVVVVDVSRRWSVALALALLLCGNQMAVAQRGGRGGRANGAGGSLPDTTTGFVIRDSLTMRYCAGCHTRDNAGYMQRISYERKTPEGWEMSVRRMVGLNDLRIDPDAARRIVRYLSDHQGLAPAELRPGRFEIERRMVDYRYTADPKTETTCRACHSMGRVITQRRSRGEWELLLATHRSLYPDADFQAFRRGGPAVNDSGVPVPHPMDVALTHLAKAFPLRTAGVDRVVGNDAHAASRGDVDVERLRAGARRVLRPPDHRAWPD